MSKVTALRREETGWSEHRIMTPAMAETYLAMNTANFRAINQAYVKRLASLMLSGNWYNNGGSIRISQDGLLLDGQHRLAAIVMSGVSIPMVIIGGIQADGAMGIDKGRMRTFVDVLAHEKSGNPQRMSSLTKELYVYCNHGTLHYYNRLSTPRVDDHILLEFYNSYSVEERMDGCTARYTQKNPTNSSIALAHYFILCNFHGFAKTSKDAFEKIANGEGLIETSSAYAMRETLLKNTGISQSQGARRRLRKMWGLFTENTRQGKNTKRAHLEAIIKNDPTWEDICAEHKIY